jgi:Leucine-rich repeat (LRR) protein
LTNLNYLYLYDNEIGDVSGLAGLANLDLLVLNGNQISDVSALAGLGSLTMLWLQDNLITDISGLANLTNLSTLYLWNNEISDVSGLASLTGLTDLALDENRISDIGALAGLANLKDLYLWGNQISDIAPLVENPGIGFEDYVDLRCNPLSDQSIQEHIPALEARGAVIDWEDPDPLTCPAAAVAVPALDPGRRLLLAMAMGLLSALYGGEKRRRARIAIG